MFLDWLLAFVLTQAIEAPIYLRFCVPRPVRGRLWVALGASAWTHPLLWFALPDVWAAVRGPLLDTGWLETWEAEGAAFLLVAETAIWLGEAVWLRAFGGQRPWRWALVGNGASFGVGLLLQWLIGWP